MGQYEINGLYNLIDRVQTSFERAVDAINAKGGFAHTVNGLEHLADEIDSIPSGKPETSMGVGYTQNGTYTVNAPEGYSLSEVNIDVNVPGKTEIHRAASFNSNGRFELTPPEGAVFDGVTVEVDVPLKPETHHYASIINNGQFEFTAPEGWALNGVTVDVNVPEKLEIDSERTFNSNGQYEIFPPEGYLLNKVTVDVNVPDPTIDPVMSDTSENPVQNKVIKEYVDGKAANSIKSEDVRTVYTLTQEEYDQIENPDPDTLYIITE